MLPFAEAIRYKGEIKRNGESMTHQTYPLTGETTFEAGGVKLFLKSAGNYVDGFCTVDTEERPLPSDLTPNPFTRPLRRRDDVPVSFGAPGDINMPFGNKHNPSLLVCFVGNQEREPFVPLLNPDSEQTDVTSLMQRNNKILLFASPAVPAVISGLPKQDTVVDPFPGNIVVTGYLDVQNTPKIVVAAATKDTDEGIIRLNSTKGIMLEPRIVNRREYQAEVLAELSLTANAGAKYATRTSFAELTRLSAIATDLSTTSSHGTRAILPLPPGPTEEFVSRKNVATEKDRIMDIFSSL
jgi:hypothetical protein